MFTATWISEQKFWIIDNKNVLQILEENLYLYNQQGLICMDMDEIRSDEIFEAVKRREQGVFKQLFETHFKKMTLFAEYFLLDRDEAEDIAQEI